jgi:protein phosphatase PTC7
MQGDSGFLVLRQGKVVVRSSPLQHFFDCPLQFGAFPEHVEATDSADNAEIFNLPVELGDVIIAGGCGQEGGGL